MALSHSLWIALQDDISLHTSLFADSEGDCNESTLRARMNELSKGIQGDMGRAIKWILHPIMPRLNVGPEI